MRLTPRCRDITRLVLQGEDRQLRLHERVVIRLHLSVCEACTRFTKQVSFMRGAMGQWRRYGEDGTTSDKDTMP